MAGVLRKGLLLAFLAGLVGMLLFGPRAVSPAPADRVRIQYWEKWTGLEAQQMQRIVDEFNETVGREKGIWVDHYSMSQIDRKTIISTAAGAPPDVVGMWDGQVLQFAALGALEPLNDYAARYGLTREKYKGVFYDGCTAGGTLYALPSTVWCVALVWNKQVFADRAEQLRAAGCDPTRAPRTIAELDRYAAALDTWEPVDPAHPEQRRLSRAGFVPAEPGSFTNLYPYWFGAGYVDPSGLRLDLTAPEMMRTYNWLRGYSERLGRDRLAEFRSAFNAGMSSLSDNPQNPFFVGWIAMEQQGPWVTAQIEKLKPEAMRWHVPPDQLQRERDLPRLAVGMSEQEVHGILGTGVRHGDAEEWLAGVKVIQVRFANDRVASLAARLRPAVERQQFCQWGAAAFPSDIPGLDNVTYAGMDVWGIPSTATHKAEAFEFIAFASRQRQIEQLSSLHCNLSPLRDQSEEYRRYHPNPYVDVFETLASSPNARPLPRIINWPKVADELGQSAERSALLHGTTREILTRAQARAQQALDADASAVNPALLATGEPKP